MAKVFKVDLPGYGTCQLEYIYAVGKPRAVYINLAFIWDFVFGSKTRAKMTRLLNRFKSKNGDISDDLFIESMRSRKMNATRKGVRPELSGHGRSAHCSFDVPLAFLKWVAAYPFCGEF